MATIFTLRSENHDGADSRYMEVVCEQIPNVEENTSQIRWTLTVAGGEENGYSTGPTTLTIGGQQVYFSKRKSYNSGTFPAVRGSVSGIITVSHDAAGSRALKVTLDTAIYTQTITSVSETWTLDTIRRTSVIRAADANIGSCATVVIGRQSSAFSHTVAYRFGSLSGWLDSVGEPVSHPVQHTNTTLSFPLPEHFYEQIPNSPRERCYLTCTTYFAGMEIGESSCSFLVTADPALCCPMVSGVVTPADALTQSLTEGKLIPSISTACCQVTAAARKGARLVSVLVGEVEATDGVVLLPGWALPTVPVVVTDSRGYSKKESIRCPQIDYVQLADLSAVERPAPTANVGLLTLRGKAFYGSFGLQENALSVTVDFDGRQLQLPVEIREDGSYLQTLELEGLSYTNSYPVTVTVADKAMQVVQELTVRKGIPVFDWGEEDFRFHVPVELPALTVDGTPLATYIRSLLQQ